jgi:hypothetical protein
MLITKNGFLKHDKPKLIRFHFCFNHVLIFQAQKSFNPLIKIRKSVSPIKKRVQNLPLLVYKRTLVAEPKVSTPQIPKLTTDHHTKSVPFISYPHNQSPYDPS